MGQAGGRVTDLAARTTSPHRPVSSRGFRRMTTTTTPSFILARLRRGAADLDEWERRAAETIASATSPELWVLLGQISKPAPPGDAGLIMDAITSPGWYTTRYEGWWRHASRAHMGEIITSNPALYVMVCAELDSRAARTVHV